MPVTKKRPHIIELLDIAVDQRRKLHDTKVEILERPASIWYQNYGNNKQDKEKSIFKPGSKLYVYSNYFWIKLIIISRYCEKILTDKYAGYVRLLIWPLALTILLYEATNYDNNDHKNSQIRKIYDRLDIAINVWFIIDSMIRLIGTVIRIKIEDAFGREMKYFEIFKGCGFIDLIVSAFNFILGVTAAGLWIRLLRLVLITNSVLDKIPHISVLFSGISNGLKSILFTIVLLFLEMAIWASFANYFFKDNDPFYFGSYGLSLLAYFQITTFESWNDLYNVNAYGCKKYPGAFYGNEYPDTMNNIIDTGYGIFYYPVCSKPLAQPISASVLFISFVVVGSYIMISMNLAAVTIGINEKLLSLRTLQLYGQGSDQSSRIIGSGALPRRLNKSSSTNSSKVAKLLGNKSDARYFTMMLNNIWAGNSSLHKKFGANDLDSFTLRGFSWVRLQAMTKRILKFRLYSLFIVAIILIDILVQMQDQTYEQYESSRILHLVLNIFFLMDNMMHMLNTVQNIKGYIRTPNMFDFILTIIIFVPTCNPRINGVSFLGALRMLRLIRLSRICSLAITDLMVILNAVQSSFFSVLYVVALLVLLLVYFAIAGILLFRDSTPYYFGSFGLALKTLLQVMTMDNWTDVMRRNMLGCKAYKLISPNFFYDNVCGANGESGKGLGWIAAFYFILFVVLFSMVLISLLVGVIIASMELLKEGLNEENEIWDKVARVKKTYQMEEEAVDKLLELFEKLDVDCNGSLSFDQISVILKNTDFSSEEQSDFFVLMDRDKSGLIDFAEFCEMVELIGICFRQKNPGKGKNRKRDAKLLSRLPSSFSHSHSAESSVSVKISSTKSIGDDVSIGESENSNRVKSQKSSQKGRKNAIVPIPIDDIDEIEKTLGTISDISDIENLETVESKNNTLTTTTSITKIDNDIENNFTELKETDKSNDIEQDKDKFVHKHKPKSFLPITNTKNKEELSFHSRIEALFHINHDNVYHSEF